MREFEISIIVAGNEEATVEAAKAAARTMLDRARRLSPDMRFDWLSASADADAYIGNPKGNR